MSKIIGQDKLIKEVNRIFQVFVNSNCKIRPHFILTGESGSGKSFTIKQLCDMNELNFLEVNAAQITKEGISGNSLSKKFYLHLLSIVTHLLQSSQTSLINFSSTETLIANWLMNLLPVYRTSFSNFQSLILLVFLAIMGSTYQSLLIMYYLCLLEHSIMSLTLHQID